MGGVARPDRHFAFVDADGDDLHCGVCWAVEVFDVNEGALVAAGESLHAPVGEASHPIVEPDDIGLIVIGDKRIEVTIPIEVSQRQRIAGGSG